MLTRIAFVALAAPMVIFATLLAFPSLDKQWGTFSFHFYVVSAACLMSAFACLILVLSARSMRETRILFLALSFFALGMFFSIHGLTTPGFLLDESSAALQRSPWLSTLVAGFFATMSVVTIPRVIDRVNLRVPEVTFIIAVIIICAYFMATMLYPNWLTDFPTTREWFQHVLTAASVGLLGFAALRYYQAYLFARLPAQLSVAVGLVFLAEAQISLDFGVFWAYSWWMYHGLFLLAFVTVLGGWSYELIRAKDARAIAEGIAMRDALAQLNRGRPADLVTLADQIENHDLETFRHVDRVATFAYAIGSEMGLGAAKLRELVLSAQMHDLGKIGLPPYILRKEDPLTDDEWAQIRQHPAKGFEIMERVSGLGAIARTIRHHHERWDGNGYPDKLTGSDIPLESRIISVADTYDALTSHRPYRPAMTPQGAHDELAAIAGRQLDPDLVAIMIRLIDRGAVKAAHTHETEAEHVHF
ncbi:MAG TPA: HD domain-containing phosphohydrolase [Dehalococcoidia bacterium]|nr:HD domain-containing phosphohydrolase [Dehalococcoidia bacterium]